MKLILHPLSLMFLLLSGSLLLIEVMHNYHHEAYESDVHGYVKQFCRKNIEVCEEILREI